MVENKKIVLGIIGYNDGNGHPYSFSAIINGYDSEMMNKSPYPNIAAYLDKRDASEFGVNNFVVDYIWTQDKKISENIAACSKIRNVADDYMDMIDHIDAVIIARDDAESHKSIAGKFLEKGKYVFVDKPLCVTYDDLLFFEPFLKNGQLMSCSGFRYHPLYLDKSFVNSYEKKIVFATAITTIDWYKYGIHILEAIQPLMQSKILSVQNIGKLDNDIVKLDYENGKYALIVKDNRITSFSAHFFTDTKEHLSIDFNDNFTYFRNMLFDFHRLISKEEISYSYLDTLNLISALIASKEAKSKNKIIFL